jgi:hypothetical protein
MAPDQLSRDAMIEGCIVNGPFTDKHGAESEEHRAGIVTPRSMLPAPCYQRTGLLPASDQ